MVIRFKVVLWILSFVLLPAAPSVAAELTHKEYANAPDAWKRGFVLGIARYMSIVAQPDEEPPYPLREAMQRCLASATDSILVRQVDAYVAAHQAGSQGPMVAVVIRAFFDLCRSQIEKLPAQGRKAPR
jgi:hypothetical protein